MGLTSRHQCLIYDGPPSRQLPAIAAVIEQKLNQKYRCLYLNSRPMVAGVKSCLAAAGVDVAHETEMGNLALSSEQNHLGDNAQFDVDRMIATLQRAINEALDDGYQGLWATGDMSFEFGPTKDLSRLLEYEWRLEELFRTNPQLGGICQYHAESLPRDVLRKGLLAHPQLFVNETLAMINPHYLHSGAYTASVLEFPQLDLALDNLLNQESAG